MDIGRILSRSLEIAWRYKFLWLLGFVMALTGGGGGGGSSNYNFNSRDFNTPPTLPRGLGIDPNTVIVFVLCALCVFFLLWLFFLYLRFVARGAMVSAVRTVENNGSPTLGTSWREGQSLFGRLFGLGLLVNVPLVIFSLLVIAAAFLPFIGSLIALANQAQNGVTPGRDVAPIVSSVFGFVALLCCAVICLVILSLIIHPIYEFAVRAIVLENTGTIEGLSRGYNRLRANLGNSLILYIVLIGARIGWAIVTGIVSIPIFLVFVFALMGMFRTNPTAAIVLGIAIGLPLVLIFVFLEGLFQVFESNAWTLGYMSLLAPPQTVDTSVLPAGPTSPAAPPATV